MIGDVYTSKDAEIDLEMGQEYPCGNTAGGDWAQKAANGVLTNIFDRIGFDEIFDDIEDDVCQEIVAAIAEIIRQAELLYKNA